MSMQITSIAVRKKPVHLSKMSTNTGVVKHKKHQQNKYSDSYLISRVGKSLTTLLLMDLEENIKANTHKRVKSLLNKFLKKPDRELLTYRTKENLSLLQLSSSHDPKIYSLLHKATQIVRKDFPFPPGYNTLPQKLFAPSVTHSNSISPCYYETPSVAVRSQSEGSNLTQQLSTTSASSSVQVSSLAADGSQSFLDDDEDYVEVLSQEAKEESSQNENKPQNFSSFVKSLLFFNK